MKLDNQTLFAADLFIVQDGDGNDLLLVVVKATYAIGINEDELTLHQKQEPLQLSDKYYDTPENSGIRCASDIGYGKCGTDIAVIGHAYAPGGYATESSLTLKVGQVRKTINVFGDRFWKDRIGFTGKTRPLPFERIPIVYELAFGGEDKSHANPEKHEAEQRNLIGTGFRARKSKMPINGTRLPNFEDPDESIKSPYDRPKPAGFGFVSPMWQPRLGYAGTYDKVWEKARKPLLPLDFDTKFFNAAHPDLVFPGFLRGDEPVMLAGVTERGTVRFSLPADAPKCSIKMADEQIQMLEMRLDKLLLNCDELNLVMVWGASMKMPEHHEEIHEIELHPSKLTY